MTNPQLSTGGPHRTPLVPSSRLHYGGDYNPEQWSTQVWDDDVTLMQAAGVTVATVGVFAWSRLEPRPGDYQFAWLDDVLDRLHSGGIQVMLATATASPPAWLAALHPESLPETADGVRLAPGSRQHFSPSSAAFRRHALRLVEQIATRYADHPALAAWHIGNEYGCHVAKSYDPETRTAFRAWLQQRYGSIDALNSAWCTAFWSQQYGDFSEIDVPRSTPTFPNPTQSLDFDRFSSDAMLDLYLAEKEVLRRITPDVPVTTNFMGFFKNADYWQWAPHLDFISDDVYPDPSDPDSYVGLAAQRDLMRSLAGDRPWIVMESATGAVQWRSVNTTKPPGMHRMHSLQALARGADGILHFQWRQSAGGAERFHAAMVPHAGPDSRIFREVRALGAELASMPAGLVGAAVPAHVAILLDWDSWRAVEQPAMPSTLSYLDHLLEWYRPFLRAGVTVDFRAPDDDLSRYDLVVAPMLHVLSDDTAEALDGYVQRGGTLVVGCFSGVVDRDARVWLGGYLGPLSRTLGVRVEEHAPMTPGSATTFDGQTAGTGHTWRETVVVDDAEIIARFQDGHLLDRPAVTRRSIGAGAAWYVATMPSPDVASTLADRWLTEAGVPRLIELPADGVEAVRRGDTVFVINHADDWRRIRLVDGTPIGLRPYEVVQLDPRAVERIATGPGNGISSTSSEGAQS